MSKVNELIDISKNISIIYAEDEEELRLGFKKFIDKIFSDVRAVSDGQEALNEYKKRACDIIITDIKMPNLNGLGMLREVFEINPMQETIITSAYTEREYLLESIELGVNSYIMKPFNNIKIIDVLIKVVNRINQAKENELYHKHLEELVEQEIKERDKLKTDQIENYEQTLLALINMVEQRDSYTAGHSIRVATYSKMIAQEMKLSEDRCDLIYRAGSLHDIGKIATPDAVLLKPGKLNVLEQKLIQEHVKVGFDMLFKIPMFKEIAKIIHLHHEHYDGSGYPKGIKGDEIDELAHIMIVADAFDAMTSTRIYKARKSLDEALAELEKLKHKQFHPNVVESAAKVLSLVTIDETITQFPQTELEQERFVYFFNDRVTGLYNTNYLDLILLKNSYNVPYKCVNIISLHNFKAYNTKYGWEMGDKLLLDFANRLKDFFIESLVFRVHANDFIILNFTHQDIDLLSIPNIDILGKEAITLSIKHLDIEDENINSMAKVDKRLILK